MFGEIKIKMSPRESLPRRNVVVTALSYNSSSEDSDSDVLFSDYESSDEWEPEVLSFESDTTNQETMLDSIIERRVDSGALTIEDATSFRNTSLELDNFRFLRIERSYPQFNDVRNMTSLDSDEVSDHGSVHSEILPEYYLVYPIFKRSDERLTVIFSLVVKVKTFHRYGPPTIGPERTMRYLVTKNTNKYIDEIWEDLKELITENGSVTIDRCDPDALSLVSIIQDPLLPGNHLIDIKMLTFVTLDMKEQTMTLPEDPIAVCAFLEDIMLMIERSISNIRLKSFVRIYKAVLDSVSTEIDNRNEFVKYHEMLCMILSKLEEKEVYLIEICQYYLAFNMEVYIKVLLYDFLRESCKYKLRITFLGIE